MRVEGTSNFPAFIAAFRRANAQRKVALKTVLSKHGSDYIRKLIKTQLTGRPGLNRPTGFGARSWYRIVAQRGDTTELVVFTTASYLRFHADDYLAPEPRRYPVRLRAGELWRAGTTEAELVRTLDAIMLRRKR